jgi:hypothetical protein
LPLKKEKNELVIKYQELLEANNIQKITLEDLQKKIKNLEKDKEDLLEILKSPSKKCSIKLHEIVATNKSQEVKKLFSKL